MIKIKIICVGELREKSLSDLQNEYTKRLSKYCNLEIITLKDEKLPSNLNDGNISIVKEKEADLIINKLQSKNNSYVFMLDENGSEYTSTEFATKIQKLSTIGNSTLIFILGGSLGLAEKVKKEANEIISFSKLTFPHQLIRIFLLEQIFRVFKIINGETYHH